MKYPQLSQLVARMTAGDRVNVVFLGGSITWGAAATDPPKTSYRALVTSWLETQFPKAHVNSIDAAIGGTGSKLGVFRMDRDVTAYDPDLVIIEFAVNDSESPDTTETMEGILRKLHAHNPETAVVILVLGAGGDYAALPTWTSHRCLAASFGLPCIDVVSPIQKLMKEGLSTTEFLSDGCHPNDTGYRLYADIIRGELARLAKEQGPPVPFPPRPLTENRFASAHMIELSTVAGPGEWTPEAPSPQGTWFDHQPSRWHSSAVVPTRAGATLKVRQTCSGIGLYFELTRDGGPFVIKADGETVLEISTSMDFPGQRVGWTFSPVGAMKDRLIELIAPRAEKTKAAYLLLT
ncbi:MAG: SGNH/GDSL hydrolase family protein [Planctomycetota bacterium]|nr:SGNH/GDSL hydrolase family protein [Planctomycetota bacterium]